MTDNVFSSGNGSHNLSDNMPGVITAVHNYDTNCLQVNGEDVTGGGDSTSPYYSRIFVETTVKSQNTAALGLAQYYDLRWPMTDTGVSYTLTLSTSDREKVSGEYAHQVWAFYVTNTKLGSSDPVIVQDEPVPTGHVTASGGNPEHPTFSCPNNPFQMHSYVYITGYGDDDIYDGLHQVVSRTNDSFTTDADFDGAQTDTGSAKFAFISKSAPSEVVYAYPGYYMKIVFNGTNYNAYMFENV